ncbi:hypothetical protein RCL1_001601 [Eukaryota sp. TZLM3-RCL]
MSKPHNITKNMAQAFKAYNERERFSSHSDTIRGRSFEQERLKATKRLFGKDADTILSSSVPSRKRSSTAYEASHDRFSGYDEANYKKVIDSFDPLKHEERKNKQQQLLDAFQTEPDPEQVRFPSSNMKQDQRTGIKSGSKRSRTEGAKFLEDDVIYDPKTRSVQSVEAASDGLDFESSFDTSKGSTFAWENTEIKHKDETDSNLLSKLMELKEEIKKARDPSVVQSVVVKSRWVEDDFEHGHSSVYGSYFNNGSWGYACCKQTIRDCVCLKQVQQRSLASHVVS